MHARISVSSLCFPSAGLSQLRRCWAQLGARRVSLLSRTLLGEGEAAARAALAVADCQLETISHLFFSGGPISDDEVSWAYERRVLAEVIEAAARLGGRSVYVQTGGIGDLEWEQAATHFSAAIAPCRELAKEHGIALMIENSSSLYADMHIGYTLRDAVAIAEQAGVGVCIDLYGCWAEQRLRSTIEAATSRCGLVQVSDYVLGDRSLPGRAVPGQGDIPLERLLGWVIEAGYEGAFELELIGPRIEKLGAVEAVRQGATHLGELLNRVDAGTR